MTTEDFIEMCDASLADMGRRRIKITSREWIRVMLIRSHLVRLQRVEKGISGNANSFVLQGGKESPVSDEEALRGEARYLDLLREGE